MQTESNEVRKYLDDRKREAEKADLPPEVQQVGREYFARRPDSEIWVSFGDLPHVVSRRLMELHERELAFPAGIQELLA